MPESEVELGPHIDGLAVLPAVGQRQQALAVLRIAYACRDVQIVGHAIGAAQVNFACISGKGARRPARRALLVNRKPRAEARVVRGRRAGLQTELLEFGCVRQRLVVRCLRNEVLREVLVAARDAQVSKSRAANAPRRLRREGIMSAREVIRRA